MAKKKVAWVEWEAKKKVAWVEWEANKKVAWVAWEAKKKVAWVAWEAKKKDLPALEVKALEWEEEEKEAKDLLEAREEKEVLLLATRDPALEEKAEAEDSTLTKPPETPRMKRSNPRLCFTTWKCPHFTTRRLPRARSEEAEKLEAIRRMADFTRAERLTPPAWTITLPTRRKRRNTLKSLTETSARLSGRRNSKALGSPTLMRTRTASISSTSTRIWLSGLFRKTLSTAIDSMLASIRAKSG